MNLCRSCREDFGSVAAFDAHRVGKHAYLYSAEHPDGRRCLSIEEIERDPYFVSNDRGRWSLAADLERARELRERNTQRPTGIPEAA